MNEKKRIAFVTRDLSGGGVENTLFNLINALDKDRVDVSLILFDKSGSFYEKIPPNVKIFCLYDEELIGARLCYKSKQKIIEFLQNRKLLKALKLFYYERKSLHLAKKDIPHILTNFYLERLHERPEQYDVVVDFHGYGDFTTYYAVNKIKAKKYVTWLHDEQQNWLALCEDIYAKYDKVFACSKMCREQFINFFPQYKEKCDVFYNILPVENIKKKSELFYPEELKDKGIWKLLTVGRMTEQKGYDIAIEVATKLKNQGIRFKWFFMGEGKNKSLYQNMVERNSLQDEIRFLEFQQNPYPYMKACDIYVQPSRHEGYCTTISEAMIIGCIVIATNVSGVDEQIVDGKNGLIAEINSSSIFNSIHKVISDGKLRNTLSKNVSEKKQSFSEELKKFYELID